MGSMIHLSVGRLEIDWGKNSGFTDHSPLFQPSDLTQVQYYYVDEHSRQENADSDSDWHLVTELKDGLSKPLSQVIDRINLLGYSIEYVRREFEWLSQINEFNATKFNFNDLAKARSGSVCLHSLNPFYKWISAFFMLRPGLVAAG